MLYIHPQNIVFLDRNICIEIFNDRLTKERYDELQTYNNNYSFIFCSLSLLEGGFRDKDFKSGLLTTLTSEGEKLTKFFDKAIVDVNNFKDLIPIILTNSVGNMDFRFDNQIEFYEYVVRIIKIKPKINKINNIKALFINKVKELQLKFYFPLVMASFASLYNDKARKLLKISKGCSVNVVNDMVHILRISSMGVNFIKKFNLKYATIKFITNDDELDNFWNNINEYDLNCLLTNYINCKCPIDKKYFKNISDDDWCDFKQLVKTI